MFSSRPFLLFRAVSCREELVIPPVRAGEFVILRGGDCGSFDFSIGSAGRMGYVFSENRHLLVLHSPPSGGESSRAPEGA